MSILIEENGVVKQQLSIFPETAKKWVVHEVGD
jgi:hypothetical protein